MGKKWINEKLKLLEQALKYFNTNSKHFLFEPIKSIYSKLESGNEDDLQEVTNKIAQHICIVPPPDAKFDWGIRMEPETSGQFSMTRSSRVIQIPFFYVGKKYAVGAILAHEITHAFLLYRGIILKESMENEIFTDIASIYIGLGKLRLNGLLISADDFNNEIYSLGYLKPEEFLYCYKCVCKKKLVPIEIMMKNLNPVPQKMMEAEMNS